MSHLAALIKEKHGRLEITSVPTPTPGPGELLVKVQAITFNPIEYKMQEFQPIPIPYPNNLGMSSGGIVEKIGEGVTGFTVGDRVATIKCAAKMTDPLFGSHQQFQLVPSSSAGKLPPSVPLDIAASISLNLSTIFSALTLHLGLDRPSLTGTPAPKKDEKVLLYGGSSSAGALAIRLVRAAGYHVVTTSSPRNLEFVSSLGPDAIIDHTQCHADIVSDIKNHRPYAGICDVIGTSVPVTNILIEYLSSIGGGRFTALDHVQGKHDPIPDDVERVFAPFGWDIDKNAEAREYFYEELLPKGLLSGMLVPVPLQRVEGGISGVQHALDLLREKKVSCVKLVLDPWAE